MSENTPAHLSDKKLFDLCKRYGEQALLWRRRFIGLLPEVHRRELHKKKGYTSIFEFAAKIAGLSERQVSEALNPERRFRTMPALHATLIKGEASVNKLIKVAPIATEENQQELSEKVKILSKSAVETLVRDEKAAHKEIPPGRVSTPHLSEEVKSRLAELGGKGIDINAMLTEMLNEREQKIAQEKENLAENQKEESSRHIPVAVRRMLKREHGEKCSIPYCAKPAQQLHHTQRFALAKNHDPRYIAPLCKDHHQIAHSIDRKYQESLRSTFRSS